MEESEKMLEVAEPTEEVAEQTTEMVETPVEESSANEQKADNQEENNLEESAEELTDTQVESNIAQESDDNAKFAQIRRKAEADANRKLESEKQKAFEEGRLAAYKGKLNPYTEKPITDLADIEIYETMFKLDQEGKDPLNDLPEALANSKREEQKLIQDRKKLEEQTRQELDEFATKYPDINVKELLENPIFNDYIQGKNKPIIELYEGFNRMNTYFRNSAVEVAKQTIANSQATPGKLGGEADQTVDYNSMSSEDFNKYVEKVINGETK